MKATEQYFPVVLFIILYEVVLTFEFVNGIQKCEAKIKLLWLHYFYNVIFQMYFTTPNWDFPRLLMWRAFKRNVLRYPGYCKA